MATVKITTKDAKKLAKALKLVSEAQTLIQEVQKSCEDFKYGHNTTSLIARVSGAVSVLDQCVNDKSF